MTGVNGIDGVELTGVFGVNAGQGELCSAEPVKSLARRAIQSCGFFHKSLEFRAEYSDRVVI